MTKRHDSGSDFSHYINCGIQVQRWRAECSSSQAQLQYAQIQERCAELLSQYEPVASMDVDREELRKIFKYILHGIKISEGEKDE